MNRRRLLKTGLGLAASAVLPASYAQLNPLLVVRPGWNNYEMTTRIKFSTATAENQNKELPCDLWIPLPSINSDYQRTISSTFTSQGVFALIKQDPRYGASFLHVQSPGGKILELSVQSRFRTSKRATAFDKPQLSSISPEDALLYTRATQLIPTSGLVRDIAQTVVGKKLGAVPRARAIYQWVLENSRYTDRFPGQGSGDVSGMLVENDFSGASIDISTLFVALARSLEIPARLVTGIWAGPSLSGYRSLGVLGNDVTKAQHCRVEFFDQQLGWIGVDPASVKRAMFYDSKNKNLMDERMTEFAQKCFGQWDMNWVGLNYAVELALPGVRRGVLPFFMYPNGEAKDIVRDGLRPDAFQYTISTKPLTA